MALYPLSGSTRYTQLPSTLPKTKSLGDITVVRQSDQIDDSQERVYVKHPVWSAAGRETTGAGLDYIPVPEIPRRSFNSIAVFEERTKFFLKINTPNGNICTFDSDILCWLVEVEFENQNSLLLSRRGIL